MILRKLSFYCTPSYLILNADYIPRGHRFNIFKDNRMLSSHVQHLGILPVCLHSDLEDDGTSIILKRLVRTFYRLSLRRMRHPQHYFLQQESPTSSFPATQIRLRPDLCA